MATVDLYDPATSSTRHVPAIVAGIRRLWAGYRQRRQYRKMAMTLLSLDDHLLRDIGIEPQDVLDAIHGRPGPSILFNPMRRHGRARAARGELGWP